VSSTGLEIASLLRPIAVIAWVSPVVRDAIWHGAGRGPVVVVLGSTLPRV
jgi:hypothetical protein